jgi:glyoxylase-like metal-dependent hydrolase (beta-lactamase superfamily II)
MPGGAVKVRTLVVIGALLIPVILGGVLVLGVAVQLPIGNMPRVKGPHDMIGVLGQSTYGWVIPAGEKSVVIVDAGQDPSAKALRGEVGGREVLAVLMTHGHSDTSAGIDAFPDATLVYGPGEGPLLRGEVLPQGWLASWLARSAPKVRLPETIVEATDGQVLEFGTARIRVTHVPGHTAGSVVYQWRDVALVGDAVLVKPDWMMMPEAFSDAPEQACLTCFPSTSPGSRMRAVDWSMTGGRGWLAFST